MKLSDVFRAIMKLPRKVWILAPVLLVTLLLLSVYIRSRPASSEKSAPHAQVSQAPTPATSPPSTSNNHQNSEASAAKSPAKVPPRILDFLIGAVVASFILAGFISLNRRDLDWRTQHILLVGSLISVVSVALIVGSFHLSDDEPGNKTVFLIAANFVAISLLVLAVCYVPHLVAALQGIKSIFLKITALLCFAGAAGGFAYHLVHHDGNLVLPELVDAWVEVNRPSFTRDNVAAKPTKSETTSKESSVLSEKTVKLKEKVKRRAFHIGFIGDVLLGLVAANALHLALASLVKYDAKDEDKRGHYFTFLALGILGGFAGAQFLSSAAQKLAPSEVREIVRDEVGQNVKTNEASPEQAIALPQAAETAKAVTDSLTRFEWPNDAELALMKSFGGAVKETKKPVEKFSVDELVAAAGCEFFVNTSAASSAATKRYTGLIVDQPTVPRTQGWSARMLRALSVIYEGTRLSKAGWYAEVRSDLGELFFDAASGEQRSAGALLGNFATFAAVISNDLEKPDWDMISRRLDWGTSGAKSRTRKAVGLARELTKYMKEGAQTTSAQTPPTGQSTPPSTNVPTTGTDAALANPAMQQINAVEDRVALLRLANALRAIPKQFLENLKASDTEKSAISSIAESAPSYPPKTQASPTPVRSTPSPNGTPSSEPALSKTPPAHMSAPATAATPTPALQNG